MMREWRREREEEQSRHTSALDHSTSGTHHCAVVELGVLLFGLQNYE